jgi:hypothetical protein
MASAQRAALKKLIRMMIPLEGYHLATWKGVQGLASFSLRGYLLQLGRNLRVL